MCLFLYFDHGASCSAQMSIETILCVYFLGGFHALVGNFQAVYIIFILAALQRCSLYFCYFSVIAFMLIC